RGRFQTREGAGRNGLAMTQAGGAQTLTGKQAVGDQRTVQAVQVFKQQTGFFKSALLAGRFNTDQHLGGGQNLRKTVHNDLLVAELCTLQLIEEKKGHKKAACPANGS